MDPFNNNLDLHIRLAKGSIGLTAIPSLHVSFLLNPKPARNVTYALQTTSPNFPHFLAFFPHVGLIHMVGPNKTLCLSLVVTF